MWQVVKFNLSETLLDTELSEAHITTKLLILLNKESRNTVKFTKKQLRAHFSSNLHQNFELINRVLWFNDKLFQ